MSRPRRGRAGRRLVGLLLVIVLLAACCVAGELVARSRVEALVRDALPGLSEDGSVSTHGLVLPQLIGGTLDGIDVDASSLTLEAGSAGSGASSGSSTSGSVTSLTLDGVAIGLSEVGIDAPHQAGSLTATGTLTWDALAQVVAQAAPDLPELTFGSSDQAGSMTASGTVVGLDIALTLRPAATDDGGLSLDVTGASVAGQAIDLDGEVAGQTLTDWLGLGSTTITVPRDVLPGGLAVSGATIAEDGLRLRVTGSEVALDSLAS